MQMQLIVTLLIALVLIVLTIQNPNPVPVQFMSWGVAQGIPLIIIILVSALAGVVASSLLGLKKQLMLRRRIRELQMELEESRRPLVTGQDEVLGDA